MLINIKITANNAMPKQANNEMNLYISFYTYSLGIIPLFYLIGFELSTPVQRGT